MQERTRVEIPADAWTHIFTNGFVEFQIEPTFLELVVPVIQEGLTRMSNNPAHHEAFKEVILNTDEMGWPQDSGLVRRSDSERKWFFHYCGDLTYSHLCASGAPVHEYENFFRALAKINARARIYAYQLAYAYDTYFSCPSGPLAPRIKNAFCLTRALRYMSREETESYDAGIHFDRSFITPHWISTQPGLMLFAPDGTKHEARETSYDTIAMFPSKKFAAVTRGKHGFGTAHGVKNKLRHKTTEDRFALVSFVHIPLSPEDVAWLKSVSAQMEHAEKKYVI